MVLTIEIPRAYVAEYKAHQEKVAQAATKAAFNIIAAQERQTAFLRDIICAV